MRFKKQLFLIFLLTSIAFPSFSQEEKAFKGTTVYAELFGNSTGRYTINAEKAVFTLGSRVGFVHVGFGTFPVADRNYWFMAVPAGVSLVRGKGNHHTDLGITFTYAEGFGDNSGQLAYFNKDLVKYSKALFFIPSFAYRFQKPTGGFFLKFQFSPMYKLKEFTHDPFLTNSRVYFWNFGLGLGYFIHQKANKKKE